MLGMLWVGNMKCLRESPTSGLNCLMLLKAFEGESNVRQYVK